MRTADEWLSPYVPTDADPFDRAKAAHLGRRAGFGFTDAEIERSIQQGPQRTLDLLLQPAEAGQERFTALLEQIGGELLDLSKEEDLQAWWVFRMLHTPDPLREKLTLFWHGHFATSLRKVERAALMQRQNETLRTHALGRFGELLQALAKDPAMLIWLDNRVNRKGKPNENWARELMELFTLGVGNYSEQDIKEVARAFTGWTVREDQFFFDKAQHDEGKKTIHGKEGAFDGGDVITILLEQPACARFVAGKLFRFFVAPKAPEGVIETLAARLQQSGYDLAACVETILRSRVFFSAQARRTRIKSPVEFVLGIVKSLELRADCRGLARATRELGQALFAPPTVKGWDGERIWLSAQWLVNRANIAMGAAALRGGWAESRFEPLKLLERKQAAGSAADVLECIAGLLLDGRLPAELRPSLLEYLTQNDGKRPLPFDPKNKNQIDAKARGLAHLLMTTPEYQLA